MGKINLNDIDGIRKPVPEEISKITRYYEHLYATGSRMMRPVTIVFAVLGAICVAGYTVSGIPSVVIGIVFLVMAARNSNHKRSDSVLNVIHSGDFIVIPGSVYEIKTDTTGMLGVSNVKFMSHGGIKLNTEFRVRHTDLHVGTPLLLIHVDEDEIKHGLTRVFTPFMLTEEGLKGTLF